MALDPETAETLGMLKAHVQQAQVDRESDREFKKKMYELTDKINEKADAAHNRMDKLDTKFGTLKYVASIFAALVAWVVSFFTGE